MKTYQVLFILVVVALFSSCRTDADKADAYRLANKFDEAAELYKKAAVNGDAYAMWCLSKAYGNGDGVEFDESMALEWLQKAAEAGCDEAKYNLGRAYCYGWYGLEKDVDKGKAMMKNVVNHSDNVYVMSKYAGELFTDGVFEQDIEEGMKILNNVKDKNDPGYLYEMACVYGRGNEEIDIDINKAIDYFEKSFVKGRRYSAYCIAWTFLYGESNFASNVSKGIEWLNEGIEANETNCMVLLANLCLDDEADSVFKVYYNPQKGLNLLNKAKKHGSGWAYERLGWEYYSGKHVGKDDEKSFEMYKRATELRSASGAFSLGFNYINGQGCEKNIDKGIETWEKAAELGSGGAANNLYCYYYEHEYGNTSVDKEKAKKYLLMAAKSGDDVGCRNLANHYYRGSDLFPKDEQQAFIYMKMAADQGDVRACGAMAYFYRNGIGCEVDVNKAKEYEDMTKPKEESKKDE